MEGKGRKYGLTTIAFPFGAGVKCDLGERASVGFEWGLRRTFTDYLDDVSTTYVASDDLAAANGTLAATLANRSLDENGQSYTVNGVQRGNSNTKDWYVISGIYLTFKIGKKNVCPKPL